MPSGYPSVPKRPAKRASGTFTKSNVKVMRRAVKRAAAKRKAT